LQGGRKGGEKKGDSTIFYLGEIPRVKHTFLEERERGKAVYLFDKGRR